MALCHPENNEFKGSTPSLPPLNRLLPLPLPQLVGKGGAPAKGGPCGVSEVASVQGAPQEK